MLLSRHCPHTGVVNFYDAAEPHLSIGSITRDGKSARQTKESGGYTWRLHAVDLVASGRTRDEMSAERYVRSLLAKVPRLTQAEWH